MHLFKSYPLAEDMLGSYLQQGEMGDDLTADQ
jgi:hypothetical protein